MAFPETERVVYERNTLEEVKCQIRFPPILMIEAGAPAAFQERVRSEFPHYEVKSSIKLPAGVPSVVAKVMERDLSLVGAKTYAFSSEDRAWTLELTKDGLSLSCRQYERWEEFRRHLQRALETLTTTYHPSFFNHTCVRYKNSVRRQPLALEGTPWSALLRPWVSGPFDRTETADEVEALKTQCRLRLPDNAGRVDATFSLGVHQPSQEPAFIIEAHVFNDTRKEQNDVLPCLDTVHRQARLFFRWCITDELHRAMRPNLV